MSGSDSHFRDFGLYCMKNGVRTGLAIPVWDWGKYYQRILENIRYGLWRKEEETKALNYWWGLSAGVVDTIISREVPAGVKKLVNQMGENIRSGDFVPFDGIVKAQNGVEITCEEHMHIDPRDIMQMDWLLENVEGRIPHMEELTENAQEMVRIQGLAGVDNENTGNS
jgi:hypothetical protein